jgi:glycerol uptake facilitator-like aquaporin
MNDQIFARRVAAEFGGTAMLLAAVVGSGIMADKLSGGNVALALLANSLATGAILFVLITILGPISGAHFNPAVTAVMRLRKAISVRDTWAFVAAQVAGGICGVVAAHAMFDQSLLQASSTLRHGTGQWIAEAVATFGLIVTILGAVRYRPDAVATAVGLYIVSAYWFTASTSFANPAVTIARAVTNTFAGIAPADVAGFIAAQSIGALAGFVLGSWLFDDVPAT